MKPIIPIDDLRRVLHYEPETGKFFRKYGYRGSPIKQYVERPRSEWKPVNEHPTQKGYTKIRIGEKAYFSHRLAWYYVDGEWPDDRQIDHVNGVRDDNRIENLRLATPGQNTANAKRYRTNTTGYKGVSPRENGKFRAVVYKNKKSISCGSFDTPEAAFEAYKVMVVKLHGEFARFE